MNRVIEVKEKLTSEREFVRETETVRLEDLSKISTWIGLFSGRKGFPTPAEELDVQAKRLEKTFRRKGIEVSEATKRKLAGRIVTGKYAPKSYGTVHDIKAYRFLKDSTVKYFAGEYALEEFVPVYGTLTFDGKEVIGYQNGRTAYFKADPKEALGSYYSRAIEETGLSEKQFKWAYGEYVKLHENNEAAYQQQVLVGRLSPDEHGKLEAYTVKSLKRIKTPEAQAIYRVATVIDSLRQDEFGEKIRKYLEPDIEPDIRAFDRRFGDTGFGYKYAEAA
jgi:hypothetical protein